ncbi:putative translation initiation factor 4E [Blattamonas nauphoetae]|uniref:Translation initiation factor 4E n=1 Tax=Blattamonas nauphoetae TaxID=2049346 RepID=A0ABQ9Y3X4_9EUKA|nr:putative translation initiation factor 4E [Blattamonas nauphoetae]
MPDTEITTAETETSITQQLLSAWTLYQFVELGQSPSLSTSDSLSKPFKPIATFKTLDEFSSVIMRVPRFSSIPDSSYYSVFKDEILPDSSDKRNEKGLRVSTIILPHASTAPGYTIDELFSDLMIWMICGDYDLYRFLNGISYNPQRKSVDLWVSKAQYADGMRTQLVGVVERILTLRIGNTGLLKSLRMTIIDHDPK